LGSVGKGLGKFPFFGSFWSFFQKISLKICQILSKNTARGIPCCHLNRARECAKFFLVMLIFDL
jgi:hypothetical protein